MKAWLARWAPPTVAGVVPAALLSLGVARFMLIHFFVRPPFLLDSGWYSAIVYRAGLLPHNPEIAHSADWYYAIHFSPFVSAFSVASYLAPLARIEWYALFQALVFVPLGIATYALASQVDPAGALRRLPITFVTAISFALGGQVLWLVNYPHYEAAIPGLVCLTLVSLVTGRTRLAWALLVVAASVREDAGFHAALALVPLLYLSWRGVELRASPRTIVRMIALAIGISVFGMAMQKLVFHSADLLRTEYLGDPAYDHLTLSLLGERAESFLEHRQVFYYPLIATALIAAVRRDARYLLGWAVAAPWFLINLTAHQDAKGLFLSYTGFPFIASTFWVFVYGATLAPMARRLRPAVLEATFALVCASSTLGWYRGATTPMKDTLRAMAYPAAMNRSAVHGFVDALDAHRAELGRLYVDHAVAALALESLRAENLWNRGAPQVDTIAFHRDTSHEASELLPDLVANHLDACTHVLDTGLVVCSREPLPAMFAGLATEVIPPLFVFAKRDYTGIRAPLGRLAPGTYELTLTFLPTSKPAQLDLAGGLADTHAAPAGSNAFAATLTADGNQVVSFRFSSEAPLFVTGAALRAVHP